MANKKSAKNLTAKDYVLQKAWLQYGIPTTIICLIIYFFLTKAPMTFNGISQDMSIPVFTTILICSLTVIPGVRGDRKKGKLPAAALKKADHPMFRGVPSNLVLKSLLFSFVCMLLFAMIPGGITSMIAGFAGQNFEIPTTAWFIIKSLYSGIFTALSMMLVVSEEITE